jgi:hypothetical protein
MSGVREVFVEINSNIRDIVQFGDGSVVEIKRIGTVLFTYKNGEHRSLTGVYLTINIISLGQLDEIGYEVVICSKVMKVWDEQKKLLVKVHRSSNWLYVLSMDIAQLVNLVVKEAGDAWL